MGAGTVRVGISGWTYPPWRGVFYPKGLRQADELAYAASRMSSIEVNGSFYSLQRPESYIAWRERTPAGFVLAVKGGRFITHMKKLADVEAPLANFFASGPLALREKLGASALAAATHARPGPPTARALLPTAAAHHHRGDPAGRATR